MGSANHTCSNMGMFKVNIALSSVVSPPTTSVTPRKSTMLPTKETPKPSTSGPTPASTPSASTPASTNTSPIDVTKLTTSQLKLVRSLNSSDLQSFLQSANLSAQDAQVFLKLMEKVRPSFLGTFALDNVITCPYSQDQHFRYSRKRSQKGFKPIA